jgi:hypothetical protein
MRKTVRPIRQLLVGALAAIADQRNAIAKSLFDDPIGQLDRDIEIFGIGELRPVEPQFRPLVERRKISPREVVNVARWAKAGIKARNST